MYQSRHLEKQFIIGIECGTQSLRVCCFDSSGTIVARAVRTLRTDYRSPFTAEQNADDWWLALVETVNEICQDKDLANSVTAIGISGTCSTIIPCDSAIHPTGPAILWMDNRATSEAEELREALKLAGLPDKISSEHLAPKLLWLARHRPSDLSGFLVECVSWLTFRLTGHLSVSESITNYAWGVLPHQWLQLGSLRDEVARALQAIQIPMKPPTSIAGELNSNVAILLGLQNTKRPVVVAVGGNDSLLAAAGAGMFGGIPTALEVGGTSYVLVSRTSSQPAIAPWQHHAPHVDPFDPGSWIMISSIEAAGLFINWLKDLLRMTTEELDAIFAMKEQDIENGRYEVSSIKVNLDLLSQKTKISNSGGALTNLTIRTTREELHQAVLEAIAIEAYERMELISSVCFPKPLRLLIAGGFSHNPAFLKLRASLGTISKNVMEVYAITDDDVGCRGAAMCAACAASIFNDLVEATEAMSAHNDRVEGVGELGYKLISAK